MNGWVCFEWVKKDGSTAGVGCGPPGYQLEASQSHVPTAWGAFDQPGQTSTLTRTLTAQATGSGNGGTKATSVSGADKGVKDDSGSLSVGAQAGIGIGAAAVGVALLALAAWFVLRWRQGSRWEQAGQEQRYYAQHGPGGAGPAELSSHPPVRELDGRTRSELEVPKLQHPPSGT